MNTSADIIIIGAGLTGIGAACQLRRLCPEKTFLLLEQRESMGGTWDLFRYPGVRSDSDMQTLGYRFRPWKDPESIADGPSIRRYIHDTAAEYDIEPHIQYRHKVTRARWDSGQARWHLTVTDTARGVERQLSCSVLFGCTGYYNYEQGYTPDFAGAADFRGEIIHPQKWPDHLDYTGKKVVIIGSGATAVTLVPAMARTAAHVTMLQRSPSYILPVPRRDIMSELLARFLPGNAVYSIARWRNILISWGLYRVSRARPELMRRFFQRQVRKQLGDAADMRHFTPRYNPWDERLCIVPDGDLFAALKGPRASIETGEIERFVADGILLKNGTHISADLIVTATGLELMPLGGIDVSLDGEAFSFAKSLFYKGVLFQNVPNFGMLFGYTNATWTLKAELVSEYLCRLINELDRRGLRQFMPVDAGNQQSGEPLIQMTSGYIRRAEGRIPRQGKAAPWRLRQNYLFDRMALRYGRLEDDCLKFSNPPPQDASVRVLAGS